MILSELWHPQGGGAELATYLYTKTMLDNGLKVTLFTNSNACLSDLSKDFSTVKLPFSMSIVWKPSLLLASSIIKRKVERLAKNHDIAYIPGKAVLKRFNPEVTRKRLVEAFLS